MQEKHKNILGIQHKASAKFNIFVKISTVLCKFMGSVVIT